MTKADAPPLIVWFRQDLRLADNPALSAAAKTGAPLICLYILDDETPGRWKIGEAQRWWLHESLAALDKTLRKAGASLVLRRGEAGEVLVALVRETGARGIYWNRCYEPFAIARDAKLKRRFAADGVEVASFSASLLHEPWTIATQTGEPFKVFTPFWKACLKLAPRTPLPAPKRLRPAVLAPSDDLAAWRLRPSKPDWAHGFKAVWTPGEVGALAKLDAFLARKLDHYAERRDAPARDGASGLSPHLHWGEVGPVQLWASIQARAAENPALQRSADKFLAELGWREFSHHLLYHWPAIPEQNWRDSFDAFPWANDANGLSAWSRGATGYPIVDAGMRELWATGFMHNRVRMIAASFLIKHLLIDWRTGADWFWNTLLDADLANNSASWQWVAGSGADAAPYFRIFNPSLQGERFDANGDYVRQWVPELARLPDAVLHRPWEAAALELREAGVSLGQTYPAPIVDHAAARARALAALTQIKQA